MLKLDIILMSLLNNVLHLIFSIKIFDFQDGNDSADYIQQRMTVIKFISNNIY